MPANEYPPVRDFIDDQIKKPEMGEGVVHIASLIVQLRSELNVDVIHNIRLMDNATVHQGDRDDKLIVVLETSNEAVINDSIQQIIRLNGVLTVNMVYHHCDTAESLDEVVA